MKTFRPDDAETRLREPSYSHADPGAQRDPRGAV